MKATCESCGKIFQQTNSPEERLLQAIFGQGHLCPECLLKKQGQVCDTCGHGSEILTGFNGKKYCPKCLQQEFK